MESILIVDDEPALQFYYEKVLKYNDFEVAGIAENGLEAVNMFKSLTKKPKVILMDQRMPEMTGLEATKIILQIEIRTKIIFISADISIKEEALTIGAFSFWIKPYRIEDLIIDINRAIENYVQL